MKLLGEFEAARQHEEGSKSDQEVKMAHCFKPTAASYKINSDAAIKEGRYGLGAVVRDEVCDVLMAVRQCKLGEWKWTPEEAEAMAIKLGLQLAYDVSFCSVEVETDCLRVVQNFKCFKVTDTLMF